MATNLNTILSWFKTGKKPTQEQFSATWQSFWHKDESIPQSSISNLSPTLISKVDISEFENHLDDKNAHEDLLNLKENKFNKGQPNGYAPIDNTGKLTADYLNTVNDLITGGKDKLLTAEMGKFIGDRLSVLEEKSITSDFFIATQIDSSKLLYLTDTYREIDLQPFTSTIIINSNEIIYDSGNLYIGGNFSFDNSLPAFLMKLSNCRLKNNILIFDSIEFVNLSTPIHSLIFHNDFLFTASRTTSTIITKVNPNDFKDIRTLILPESAAFKGQTTDILGYRNKLYILTTPDFYTTSNFIEISDDLINYRNIFSIPSITGYYTGASSPFLIYNDELYIPFIVNTTSISVRVYDLQGNILREKTNISINANSSNNTAAVPHWISIFNNKLLISTNYAKSLTRLDCFTLIKEESIGIMTSVTDDNSITNDGYIFLLGEKNPWDSATIPSLIKVKYNNFSDLKYELTNFNNGKGSYGSINNKVNLSGLNLLEKKDNVLIKKVDYTIKMSDFLNNNSTVVYADATTNVITITLPPALSMLGYEITILKTDSTPNIVTVKGNGSQIINGSNTKNLTIQYETIKIKSNGIQNFII